MSWFFLNSPDCMKWLREVHKVNLTQTAASAVLHGNQDSPTRIDLYENQDPRFTDEFITYLPTEEGYQSLGNIAKSSKDSVSWDSQLPEIPKLLRDACETWMNIHMCLYDRAFDIAVECAHDLELTCEDDDWQIPQYLSELAEEIKGPD